MGQRMSDGQSQYDLKYWEIIPSKHCNAQNYNYVIMRNKKKKFLEIEKYELFFNGPIDYQIYQESYLWRKNSKYLISMKHIELNIKKDLCATFYGASVYIQRIPIRLSQISHLEVADSLYLLQCCIQGYQSIYLKTGFFKLQPNFIGINLQSNVKVWLNQNLAQNHPQLSTINQNRSEVDFISTIIQIVQQKTNFGEKQAISTFMYKNNVIMNFENFSPIIHKYAKGHKILVPKSIRNLAKLMDKSFNKKSKIKKSKISNYQLSFDNSAKGFQTIKNLKLSKRNEYKSPIQSNRNMIFQDQNSYYKQERQIQNFKKQIIVDNHYKTQKSKIHFSYMSHCQQENHIMSNNSQKILLNWNYTMNNSVINMEQQKAFSYHNANLQYNIDPQIAHDLEID